MNKSQKQIFSFALIFTIVLPTLVWSQTDSWTGKVVGVTDGDTITIMHNGVGERIRLYGIDCPEKRQAFGKKAKQFTSEQVFGQHVEVRPVTIDRYDRTIAWIYQKGICLNEELLKAGLAWHYKRYSPERRLAYIEDEAKLIKNGLWADPHAVPPWEFRRGKRAVTKPKSPPIDKSWTQQNTIVYHGNVKSKKFHKPSCRYYNCKDCSIVFHSREDAINAGYIPCKVCKP